MNHQDTQRLVRSWRRLSRSATDLTVHIYRQLFEQHPEMRQFFDDDRGQWQSKLHETLNLLIHGPPVSPRLQTMLWRLGAQHESLGITPDMYPQFRDTFLTAIRSLDDVILDARELELWENSLNVISQHMLDGYHHEDHGDCDERG